MAFQSKSEKTTRGRETGVETPTYQAYANQIMQGLWPSLQQMYGLAAGGYEQAAAGMTPEERALWEQTRAYAGQYGVEGPAATYAQQYLEPTMGAGWMGQLDPYYTAQRQLVEQAIPSETAAFVQQAKREAGPAWGTHGRAAEAFGTGLAQLRMQQAQNLAGIYGQQAGAAQTGMQYTGQMAPQYTAMRDPYAWGQQRLGWAGMPEQSEIAKQQARQSVILPWSQQLAGIGEIGYKYPVSTETVGTQFKKEKGAEKEGGVKCCFIFMEGNMLTNYVRKYRDSHFSKDSSVAKGYRRLANWLVPLMRRNSFVKGLIKVVMLKPMALYAKACYTKNTGVKVLLYPIALGWGLVYAGIGLMANPKETMNWQSYFSLSRN